VDARETPMTKPISIGVVLAMFVSPTFSAEQYWIVQQDKFMAIVDEKPKSNIKMMDDKAYTSRAEAEHAMKAMKGCTPE
jgi:hypothetical protein